MPPPPGPTDIEIVDADDAAAPVGPDRNDGSTQLDFRTTLWVLFNDPAVRSYVIAALAGLAMTFLVLFMQGSDIGGLIVVLIGVAGLLFRWVAAPVFVVLIVSYFMILPFGVPGLSYSSEYEIEAGWFRMPDLMLAMAVLVYVACHYRIYGLVWQAVAFEGAARRTGEVLARRPAALITPTELGVFVGVAAALVVAGQLVWWAANAVRVTPTEDFPFEWIGSGRAQHREGVPGGMPPGLTRFVFLVGLLFFGTLVGRVVFGYWRLRTMSAAEGGMVLLDGGWDETRRERSRLEKWRIWGRKRGEAAAKAEAEAEAKRADAAKTTSRGKR